MLLLSATYDSFVGFSFNRYAYCMYNPLKYVDPTSEQYFGWSGGSLYQIEQEARRVVRQIWRDVYDNAILSHQLTLIMANAIYSNGPLGGGVHGSNGSGNHGSGGGGGNSHSEPTGNGHGDGDPSMNNNSNPDGRPGSSKNNPISANNLTDICDWHYCFGEGRPLYVDASTIDFSFLSQGVLEPVNDNIYTINLFTFPYMFLSDQLSMALGRITLTCVGDNMYEIWPDKYNFDVKHGEYFSSWRNFATAVGGVLHGGINEPTFLLYPATYWGGGFDIIFVNRVYIKP